MYARHPTHASVRRLVRRTPVRRMDIEVPRIPSGVDKREGVADSILAVRS